MPREKHNIHRKDTPEAKNAVKMTFVVEKSGKATQRGCGGGGRKGQKNITSDYILAV